MREGEAADTATSDWTSPNSRRHTSGISEQVACEQLQHIPKLEIAADVIMIDLLELRHIAVIRLHTGA